MKILHAKHTKSVSLLVATLCALSPLAMAQTSTSTASSTSTGSTTPIVSPVTTLLGTTTDATSTSTTGSLTASPSPAVSPSPSISPSPSPSSSPSTGTSGTFVGSQITNVSGFSSTDGTSVTIVWNTDQNSTSQIAYGTSLPYSAFTASDPNLVMNHTVTVNDLVPGTLYHFQIISTNSSGLSGQSPDETIITVGVTPSGSPLPSVSPSPSVSVSPSPSPSPSSIPATVTSPSPSFSPNLDLVRSEISALQDTVNLLQNQLQLILLNLNGSISTSGTSTGTSTSSGTSTGTTSASATITPYTATMSPGSGVDFNGRNFGHEEDVTVTMNGQKATIAHADGGGNFSTGSISVPNAAGTYTYVFTGTHSGDVLTSTIVVQ